MWTINLRRWKNKKELNALQLKCKHMALCSQSFSETRSRSDSSQ